jgi:hypothetical protein
MCSSSCFPIRATFLARRIILDFFHPENTRFGGGYTSCRFIIIQVIWCMSLLLSSTCVSLYRLLGHSRSMHFPLFDTKFNRHKSNRKSSFLNFHLNDYKYFRKLDLDFFSDLSLTILVLTLNMVIIYFEESILRKEKINIYVLFLPRFYFLWQYIILCRIFAIYGYDTNGALLRNVYKFTPDYVAFIPRMFIPPFL